MKRRSHRAARLFAVLVLVLVAAGLLLPKGPRDPMDFDDPWNQDRPVYRASEYAAATGSHWATRAAVDVLERGGNAFDAAVSALLVLNVTNGEAASFPGIAPLVLYDAAAGEVRSYTGAGTAPAAATLERFKERKFETVPELDIWAQLLPSSPDVITSLLAEYGTMSFAELAAPAVQTAREGFPVHKIKHRNLDLSLVERLGFAVLMPYNTQVYLDGQWWRPLYYKDRLALPDLADSLEGMAGAEQAALQAGGDRAAGIQAARDYFYEGPLAQAILDLHRDKKGLFTAADLAGYTGSWEEPAQGSYGEYTFYTNGPWSQGPVLPLILQILEGIDLAALGHNTPAYVHTLNQAIELAMADREAYMADPAFVDVPLEALLSKEYAAARRSEMTQSAFGPLPSPGVIAGVEKPTLPAAASGGQSFLEAVKYGKDTTQLAIIDQWGNAVSLTPSDFPKTPMVPGTGLTLGNRMTQFRLDPEHPNRLEPGKRPRVTPHAAIVFKDGDFWMAYSTPGDDMQAQALVQVFLNMAVFGMDIQQAINAPRFRSMTMPATFSPHEAAPATLLLEKSLSDTSGAGLRDLGYTTVPHDDWDNTFGGVGAVLREGNSLLAGSDPREVGTAGGK